MKIEKYFYLCNQKMPCSILRNGKKNEYCGFDCKHTTDEKFARRKEHKFEKKEYGNYIQYWEV